MSKVINIKNSKQEDRNEFLSELEEFHKYKESTKKEKQVYVIEFSWKIIITVLGILGLVFFSKQVINVFIFLFLSIVIMSVVLPIVEWFVSKNISKGWALGITYTLFFITVLGIFSMVINPFVSQIDNLVESVPVWVENFTSGINTITFGDRVIDSEIINKEIIAWFDKLVSADSFGSIANKLGGVFSWVSLAIISVVFSVYLVMDHDSILDFGLMRISSDEKRARVKKLVLDLENKLGKWLLGQATVSAIAGTTLGIILALLGIPFALPMGVFVALLSAIPSIGATVASIPPLLVGLVAEGPLVAFILLIIFMVYQQIENNFIIPRVMGSAAGVQPIWVLFTTISFLLLFGAWGAILAVPSIVIAKILYEFYIDLQKIQAKGSI